MPLDDTQRLDALERYGLCVTQQYERIAGEWHATWHCAYGRGGHTVVALGASLREAIDLAVLDLTTTGFHGH